MTAYVFPQGSWCSDPEAGTWLMWGCGPCGERSDAHTLCKRFCLPIHPASNSPVPCQLAPSVMPDLPIYITSATDTTNTAMMNAHHLHFVHCKKYLNTWTPFKNTFQTHLENTLWCLSWPNKHLNKTLKQNTKHRLKVNAMFILKHTNKTP